MAFDFSLVHDNFTPIKPAKVEQLFSPNVKSPARIINDLTYRIPAIPKTPTTRNFAETSLECPPDIRSHFPRQSTGLKSNHNQPLCSTVKLENESTVSSKNLLSSETSKQQSEQQPHQFQPYQQLQDTLPIRATCFHPSGDVYAVGCNSKTLRFCAYPSREDQENFAPDDSSCKPDIVYSSVGLHRGSVYCVAFNHGGTLLATGSNDQIVHIIKYDPQKHRPTGNEYGLDIHKGKVRDVCFLDSGRSSGLLASAGSGDDNSIHLTDCKVMKRVQTMSGHKDSIMSLHCWANDSTTFVSGGLDGAIKFWDSRIQQCIVSVSNSTKSINQGGDQSQSGQSPAGVVRVDPTGRLLVSGHEDGTCMLYDVRGGRQIQSFKAHKSELRTLNFSPKSYYLLTAGYDGNIKLMDLQGDLTRKLPSVDIANLNDKIIQTAWHPDDFTFVTTSADGLATLWMMPDSSNNSKVINN